MVEIIGRAISLRLTSGFSGFFFAFGRHVKDFRASGSRKDQERIDVPSATVKL